MTTIQTYTKSTFEDVIAKRVRTQAKKLLHIDTGDVRHAYLYAVNYPLDGETLHAFANNCIRDQVTEEVKINTIADDERFHSYIAIAKLPGVTDDAGSSARMALADFLNKELDTRTQHIFSQELYYFENALTENELRTIAEKLLANPLIHHIAVFSKADKKRYFNNPYVPVVAMKTDNSTAHIDLNIPDEDLLALSQKLVLALNLEEMQTIRDYFNRADIQAHRNARGLQQAPTDCELEILAQTWSEHCKHKEFNAVIDFKNLDTGEKKTINSLFKTYIKGATDIVSDHLKAKDNHWLIKVFSDNAGVVQATDDLLFVWKVETHNSPSALDPYGGAITGILGVNRDAMGTGVGGARLFFNTDVLCFGNPDYDKPLLRGQLHPRQIMEGVVKGIEDGGNKSGVPTVNGAVIFDDRYAGKPLVFCGTGALMPHKFDGKNAWEKPIDAGDLIVMAGGRVGKDGIHGATFSSIELNESSPQSAVQIGSPITQKKLADFMVIAAEQGLIKSSTDNGAGGLSSSVGELAEITNGAVVHLEKVPLKYNGLRPWEIFVSESQERMTLVVTPQKEKALFALAKQMEVEVTTIGSFTDSGFLDVRYDNACIAYIDMDFLHNGVPQKYMVAEWQKPVIPQGKATVEVTDFDEELLKILSSLNVRSRENIIRQYDHEVQGKSIIKPLMGKGGKAPQDAAVLRFDFDSYAGIAVSNGIMPQFGDLDPYEMSCGAFDEGIRQIISVGGRLPNLAAGDGIFWSVNDNFCVPDSAYHPVRNPDGKNKLGKLVLMAEGLYDMATYFDIPLTSGKDSMKNDFKAEGVKISIPPTILYSMTAKINDVRKVITAEFKAAGDLIYQIGETYDEMALTVYHRENGIEGGNIPVVRKQKAKELYTLMTRAHELDLIVSSHDLSDGGLVVAVTEALFGTGLGAKIKLDALKGLTDTVCLFSETHSRFLVSIERKDKAMLEKLFAGRAFPLGEVTAEAELKITSGKRMLIHQKIEKLENSWQPLSL